jgi:tetratricopeptide (TPR) repeat protein
VQGIVLALLLCFQGREDLAREHYQKGSVHFDLGEYDAAIAEFKQSYELSNAAGLLFNIAQAARLKKDYEQALHFYKRFVRLAPDAPNRADAEQWITELERTVAEAKAQTQTQTQTPTLTQTQTPTPSHGDGRTERLAGIAVGATGGALLIAGIAYGLSASSASDDITKLAQMGGTFNPAAKDTYDSGQSDSTKAILFLSLGGAAVVTGGILYYMGYRDARVAVAPAPLPGGLALSACARF